MAASPLNILVVVLAMVLQLGTSDSHWPDRGWFTLNPEDTEVEGFIDIEGTMQEKKQHDITWGISLTNTFETGETVYVILHIDYRLKENRLVFNSRKDTGNDDPWDNEEVRSFHLLPNIPFHTKISMMSGYAFRISVNGTHVIDFGRRYPGEKIGRVGIDGGLNVGCIRTTSAKCATKL